MMLEIIAIFIGALGGLAFGVFCEFVVLPWVLGLFLDDDEPRRLVYREPWGISEENELQACKDRWNVLVEEEKEDRHKLSADGFKNWASYLEENK